MWLRRTLKLLEEFVTSATLALAIGMAVALLLSASALTELTRAEGNDLRRVLADVVLLTPIMLFLF